MVTKSFLIVIISALFSSAYAFPSNTFAYKVTITNGGAMPLSPGVLYASFGELAADQVGQTATQGLIDLCQKGNPDTKITEIMADTNTTMVHKTEGPILPGDSKVFEVNVTNGSSLHFVSMYGKTKDSCGVHSIDTLSLQRLVDHSLKTAIAHENVLATGAFSAAALPAGGSSEAETLCMAATDAVSCLRALSQPSSEKIHYFAGYIPSLITFLESNYGVADVNSLIIPTSGATQVKIELKH